MSENVEVVRRGQDHFNRTGEPDFSLLAVDVVWDTSNVVFDRGVYRGHDGVRQWLAHQREAWKSQRYEPEELIPVGHDRVLAFLRMVGIGRKGIETTAHVATLVTLRDGKITRMTAYLDRSEALKAAGLEEQAMAQENVDLIKRGADAWSRQDAEAFLATLDPNVEWEDAMFWTEPMRVYRGRQEVREWFERALVEPWETFRLEVEEVFAAGEDRVVAGGLVAGRGRGSGIETEVHGWSIFWIANGLITRRSVFLDRADALEAAGLSE